MDLHRLHKPMGMRGFCQEAAARLACRGMAVVVAAFTTQAAENTGPTEAELKAAVVYQILRFVEWPETQPTNAPIVVALAGDGPFLQALEKMISTAKPILGRPLTVKRFNLNVPRPIPCECQVMVLSGRDERALMAWWGGTNEINVLTLSDMMDFCQKGGLVGLQMVERRVQLEVNLEACKRARLSLSSRLLRQAKIVGGHLPQGESKQSK